MDNYLKHQEVEGVIADINVATAAADKAAAALAKSPLAMDNSHSANATTVPKVPKLTLKRKAPDTDSGGGATTLTTDAEIRKVLSSYESTKGHGRWGTQLGNQSPAAKRRCSGRTSNSTSSVSYSHKHDKWFSNVLSLSVVKSKNNVG